MPRLPKTFCPAKWDELSINLAVNFAFACCKATPKKFDQTYQEILKPQQENLLNGIEDSSCKYCWDLERNNLPSRRTWYLKNMDSSKIDSYLANTATPDVISITLGHACNFQCIYCNPTFSSKWEDDVRNKPYKIFTDREHYGIVLRNLNISDTTADFLNTFTDVKQVDVIGGEPLQNKDFWKILENIEAKHISLSTNFSCNRHVIDRLISIADKFEQVSVNISIDATGKIAEFVRYGLDYEILYQNIQYLLSKKPKNFSVGIMSLMTSITIQDLAELTKFVSACREMDKSLRWELSHCTSPRTQSFETLPEKYKPEAKTALQYIIDNDIAKGADVVLSSLTSTSFNNTLYKEFKHFLDEFSNRKQIDIPLCLD